MSRAAHGRGSLAAALASVVLALGGAAAGPHAAAQDALARARADYDAAHWPEPPPEARDGVAIDALGRDIAGMIVVSRRIAAEEGAPVATVGLARVGATDVEVLLSVFVEDDAAAARRDLLTYLAGCQRPLARLEAGPGEVAFGLEAGAGGPAAIVAFVRANVAALVRWVGRGAALADAAAVAAALDAQVLASPVLEPAHEGTRIRVTRFEALARGAPAAAVPLAIRSEGAPIARAFRAARGTVQEDRISGGLVYVPAAPGPDRIEALFVSARGFRTKAVAVVEPR
jgi:hypothetical protein